MGAVICRWCGERDKTEKVIGPEDKFQKCVINTINCPCEGCTDYRNIMSESRICNYYDWYGD